MSLTGNIDPVNDELLTVREVGERTRCSDEAVRRWMITGVCGGIQLDAIRIGRRLFTSVDALRRFVAQTSGCLEDDVPNYRFRSSRYQHLSRKEVDRRLEAYGL